MPARPTAAPKRLRVLALVGGLLLVLVVWFLTKKSRAPSPLISPTNALQLLIAFEAAEAEKYWKPELEAQQRARNVEMLWDNLNHSTNRLATFAAQFSTSQLQLPLYGAPVDVSHGVRIYTPKRSRASGAADLPQILAQAQREGWQLDRCEFRFIGVSPDTFYFSAHLTNARTEERAVLEGNILAELGALEGPFQSVNASKVELRMRSGPPPFSEMFHAEVPPPSGSFFIDPLIVWDLEGDGQLEVLLAAANVAFRREDTGRWIVTRLCDHDPGLIFTALLGDFTGDGVTDFLCARFEGLMLHEGTRDGRFPNPARRVWTAQPRLRYAQTITAGDIDGDGDLDLFLGQYKLPFEKGQMPFPYFNANDGHPSFLLLNDGGGDFTDVTQKAGLAAKRGRRVYSASLVDLDRDEDLDLILVSDFAGLDAFENDGTGNFSDATARWFSETHAFGMAHSFADFNRDGWLDVLMIGMNSPTADRLASLGLARPYEVPDSGKRAAVTFGNRLFYGQADGTFRQNETSLEVARTGWSWGSAAGDLDHDGFPELYIANGHDTQASVQEYEPEFWRHDIYLGKSQENSLAASYFLQKFARIRGSGASYGGYEKNRLFLNRGGTNFIEVAHLFGVGLEENSRNVAFQDLDGDGKLDLIVTTFEAYPKTRQTIRFFRNELNAVGHEIDVGLDPTKVGASGKIFSGSWTNAFAIVSGESYRTQLPPQAHLGIGTNTPSEIQIHSGTNKSRGSRREESFFHRVETAGEGTSSRRFPHD